MPASSGFSPAPASDMIKFEVAITGGRLAFPRVRNNYKFEARPIYTNVSTTQAGVTTQTFIRNQIIMSNINFDPCTVAEFQALSEAMHLGGNRQGGAFALYYYDFIQGAYTSGNFIIKSLPITILTCTSGLQRLQLDNVTFQQV